MNQSIIVIGSSHHNTFSMVKSFGQSGYVVDVILFGCTTSYIAKSKYARHVHYIPSFNGLTECLREINDIGKPILVSCSDVVSQLLDAHYDEFIPRFHFFHCGQQGRLAQYLDKQVQTQMAASVGMKVPASMLYEQGKKFSSFPCLLKPLESTNGGKHIEICHNSNEFDEKINSFSSGTRVLAQSFIEKKSEIVVVGLSVGGDVIIPAYIYKLRESAGGTTYSKVVNIQKLNNELVKSCKQLVRSMNYIGLFGIEFIESTDGEYYFIEINLRNDATTFSVVKAGVSLPALYVKYCMGEKVTLESEIKELFSIVEFRDLEVAVHQHVPFKQWLHEYSSAECKYYNDKSDPKPFRICLKSFVKSHILHKLGLK